MTCSSVDPREGSRSYLQRPTSSKYMICVHLPRAKRPSCVDLLGDLRVFTDILAGFTFNNRELLLPAIFLLNYTRRRPELEFPGPNLVFSKTGRIEEELCC